MSEHIFKRKLYDRMLQWKKEEQGKTALLIEGARRVGKSTLARQFAQNEYKSHLVIDFSNPTPEVVKLFDDYSNMDMFFMKLKLACQVTLYKRESVIVFDEVQKVPKAREAIKHLVADGRYDYIETGSLISIQQNVESIIIPSEEEAISLYPLDYEEFRWALGDHETLDILRETFSKRISLTDGINRKLMFDFRLYMLIGGMPQAVNEYLETHDLGRVDKVKRGIIRLYANDFHKIDKTDKAKSVFLSIPSELHKNASRFQMSTVIENVKQAKALDLVYIMQDSMTVNPAYHLDDLQVGFELSYDRSTYKLYLCDTGLFVTLAFWDKQFTDNVIYQKLISDKLDANLGYVYENVVAQMLVAAGNRLCYHTFCDEQNHRYEVDFILSRSNKICPIEVKSAGYNTHKSLDKFCERFSKHISTRYLIYTKDFRQDDNTLMVPVYMTGLL